MMLFTEVRGLPVLAPEPAGSGPLGTVSSLTVDVGSGSVGHVRFRGGRFGRERALPWDAVDTIGPGAVRLRSAAAPGPVPFHHDLLGHRVLVDTGTEHGTVLDVAFDPRTARVLALFTTRGELPAERLLGLGEYALVVRAH
ncbi:PRC-barrel domain-containing protein [Streptomyces sp. NPDC093065]|uniref:PRC-barrel domain-containing protein n=1 Tax=Streptomyces sp. NPDC093065 TaxID=3366021 RepID=UPI003820535E